MSTQPADSGGESTTDLETEPESDPLARSVTRRRALQMGAAGAASAATIAASGTTLAQTDLSIDFASNIAPDPELPGTLTVSEHDTATMTQLDYVDDDGNVVSATSEDGIVLRSDDDDDATTPYNPVSYNPTDVSLPRFEAFPRDETYDESGDGSADTDVTILDATHWTSGTDVTVSDVDGGIKISSSGVTTEQTARFAEFSSFGDTERRMLQMIFDLTTLGGQVEVRVEDVNGTKLPFRIDSTADATLSDVLATATGTGYVRQRQLGNVDDTFSDDIAAIEVAIMNSDSTLTISGFDLEGKSELEFGDQKYTNSDGNVDTQTLTEPQGSTSIVSLTSLVDGSGWDDATIDSVTYEVVQKASELPEDRIYVNREVADRLDRDELVEVLYLMGYPAGFDVSGTVDILEEKQVLAGSYYLDVEVSEGTDLGSITDANDATLTARTSRFTSIDTTHDLLDVANVGEQVPVFHRLNLNGGDADALTTAGGGGAAVGVSGGSLLSDPLAVAGGVAAGVIAYVTGALGKISSLLGR